VHLQHCLPGHRRGVHANIVADRRGRRGCRGWDPSHGVVDVDPPYTVGTTGRISAVHEEVAVGGVVSADAEHALFPPVLAPRVFDDPVGVATRSGRRGRVWPGSIPPPPSNDGHRVAPQITVLAVCPPVNPLSVDVFALAAFQQRAIKPSVLGAPGCARRRLRARVDTVAAAAR